jgi:apolipoprotein N-acyltransferase
MSSDKSKVTDNATDIVIADRQVVLHCAVSAALLWLAGPPLKLWPLALIAIVPWLKLVQMPGRLDRRGLWIVLAISTVYWMITLQGLRHAHPAIYAGWIALSAYLAVYHVLFVWMTRRLIGRGVSLLVAAPLVWITTELLRNYLFSGISVLMLGHAMADVPVMIQIADLAGTYGVGWVLMVVNVAIVSVLGLRNGIWQQKARRRSAIAAMTVASAYLIATLGYGTFRLSEETGKPLATFLLLQRNEEVEYLQSQGRELEIFESYAEQAIAAVRRSNRPIDAVVWPESMFSGGAAWMFADDDVVVPAEAMMSAEEFATGIRDQRDYIEQRSGTIGRMMIDGAKQTSPPVMIAGCGVIRYGETPAAYSGVLHVDPNGKVASWYGKMHLVMFGEYIPLLPWIPGAQSLIPPGMGLAVGEKPGRMNVNDTMVSPNICIETAVERVTVAQVHWPGMPPTDVIVTVTNDGWFDDSSLIDHHLRCVQLVAAGVRRPILSSANNGPTAWVDDRGIVVDRLPQGIKGEVMATPTQNRRTSLYVKLGDWPIRLLGLMTAVMLFVPRK